MFKVNNKDTRTTYVFARFLFVSICFNLKLSFVPICVCLCACSRVGTIVCDPDVVRDVELIDINHLHQLNLI